jgi:probable HAF family extracellular repeat protein
MRDLGTLGGSDSIANAINDAGQVVGESRLTGDPGPEPFDFFTHAFLYTGTPGAGGQMIDLDAWLDANDPAEGAKWTLDEAHGISNTGWITGTGSYDPDGPGGAPFVFRAYLLDASSIVVPEPAAIGVLALGLLALRRRRS